MVTISDVAHAAGVSKATVSYVLSGDPRITQATTLKVQHAIDELGYTVNHAARALSVRKTKTIGVVSPAFHGNYLSALFGLYVYLLSEEATKRGYDTLLIGENDGFHESAMPQKSTFRPLHSARQRTHTVWIQWIPISPRLHHQS